MSALNLSEGEEDNDDPLGVASRSSTRVKQTVSKQEEDVRTQANPWQNVKLKHVQPPPPSSSSNTAPDFLPDEICYSRLDNCFRVFAPDSQQQLQGSIQLTNFRIRFTPLPCRCESLEEMGPPNWHGNSACTMRGAIYPWGASISTWPPNCSFSELKSTTDSTFAQDLPLYCFRKVTTRRLAANNFMEMEIESRMDGSKFKLHIPQAVQGGDLIKIISVLAFPADSVKSSFAFCSKHRVGLGWTLFDFDLDAERTLLDRTKRVALRKIPSPCPTYPAQVFAPANMSEAEIGESALFRAKQRLPVPVWAHPSGNGALLVRSAQPQIGIVGSLGGSWFSGSRSAGDERLIRELCGEKYLLVDARSFVAAKGNGLVRGMGTEEMTAYEGCGEMLFGDMANIHEIKSSFETLLTAAATNNNGQGELQARTVWLGHVAQLLKVSYALVHAMDVRGVSAWIHCSDGWDRTAQTCALAQLMMEPEYRTRHGFAICVEKNFATYGFKFRERARGTFRPSQLTPSSSNAAAAATGSSHHLHSNESEASPVFLLFMDGVFQLLEQFPTRFDFTPNFLLAVLDAYYSARFGTFLCDNAREREEYDVQRCTRAVWDYVCAPATSGKFTNPRFDPFAGTLHVCARAGSLSFFAAYFLRSSSSSGNGGARLAY